ncbi:unnamed protein product [Brassica oleracea var. botrytis]|uniref:Uncharacterized protein n=2 Tax=Brassica TaxID=3705 RepID=A0A3P6DS78_BRAOL|nr:unnamed protein product [Brassica napus]VDD29578.1 unnamed protein product [Brassica oleracea]
MCIKSSLSSIIPKNLQAGYNMANPQLLLSELAGRDPTVFVSVLTGSQFATLPTYWFSLTNFNQLQNVLPKVLVFDFLTSRVFLNATLGTYFYFDTEKRVLDRHIGWVSVYELNMVELTRSRVTVVDLAVG